MKRPMDDASSNCPPPPSASFTWGWHVRLIMAAPLQRLIPARFMPHARQKRAIVPLFILPFITAAITLPPPPPATAATTAVAAAAVAAAAAS